MPTSYRPASGAPAEYEESYEDDSADLVDTEQGHEPGEKSAPSSGSGKARKVPCRQFKFDTDPWRRLLQAISTAARGGPSSDAQDSSMFANVESQTCKLAWEKGLKEYDHGAVADDTEWLTLIRAVVEVEKLEEAKRKEPATPTSRKRSAELMEQNNRDASDGPVLQVADHNPNTDSACISGRTLSCRKRKTERQE